MEESKLGRKIKFFRERAGMSQMELEVAIGTSSGTFSRIEKGVVNPTKETITKIPSELELNELEFNYLSGKISDPVMEKEVVKGINEVRDYMNKKSTIAYMVDERYEVLYNLFCRIYREMNFMIDDEYYKKALFFI